MSKQSKNQMSVATPVVEVVGTPISELIIWDVLPELGELCNQPSPLVAEEGEYYIVKPTRSAAKHDGNDLGRAVTLLLQILPQLDPTSNQKDESNMLLPDERKEVTQLLLKAAYILETANATPAVKAKINVG